MEWFTTQNSFPSQIIDQVLTRPFQTRQFSKRWIPYGSLFRFGDDMFQQTEEEKEREREVRKEKGREMYKKKEKNSYDNVKKKKRKTVKKAKSAPSPD